jgi:hypothetical protein
VTPGGLGRTGGDGTPYWCHYLQATLGGVTLESDVSLSHTRPRAHTCAHWSPAPLAGLAPLSPPLFCVFSPLPTLSTSPTRTSKQSYTPCQLLHVHSRPLAETAHTAHRSAQTCARNGRRVARRPSLFLPCAAMHTRACANAPAPCQVNDKLNPSFFYTFLFRGVALPGPSQVLRPPPARRPP